MLRERDGSVQEGTRCRQLEGASDGQFPDNVSSGMKKMACNLMDMLGINSSVSHSFTEPSSQAFPHDHSIF